MRAILNYHVAPALVTDHIRHLVSNLDALKRLLRFFNRLVKIRIKVFDNGLPADRAVPDAVEQVLHICRKLQIDDGWERLLHHPVDYLAKLSHIEVLIFLRYIAARDDCRDGRCIGTWPSDALLFQRLDERRLCIMCRWLCKMLCRF